MPATDLKGAKRSARSAMPCSVKAVKPGAVTAEVQFDTERGVTLTAIVTRRTVEKVPLAPGRSATAIVSVSGITPAVAT